MSGNILRYIAHTILLKCENMFAMLILHVLILHSGGNIEILPNPRCTRIEPFKQKLTWAIDKRLQVISTIMLF